MDRHSIHMDEEERDHQVPMIPLHNRNTNTPYSPLAWLRKSIDQPINLHEFRPQVKTPRPSLSLLRDHHPHQKPYDPQHPTDSIEVELGKRLDALGKELSPPSESDSLKDPHHQTDDQYQIHNDEPTTPSSPSLSVRTSMTKEQLADLNIRKSFLLQLTKALHMYGAPVYRTEYNMIYASRSLGIKGNFVALPTFIIISFGDEDNDPAKSDTHSK